MRASELIKPGSDIRAWEEDESPYLRIAQILKDRGVSSGKVGIEDTVRFFVFDGIRKQAPKLDYVSAEAVLKAAGSAPAALPVRR
jgi:Xaa-Pro dipeptidase